MVLDKFLEEIKDNERVYTFSKDLDKHIETCVERELPLYAVHGFCTDGGTSGAMIRYAVPEGGIIPIEYEFLNHPSAYPVLSRLKWKGIVDLAPFNANKIDFYVDHHASTVGKPINAQQIRFDADGDSGAWQLYLSSFFPEFPGYIAELAVMTRTTDTAGYITEPPTIQIKHLTDLDLTITEGEEGRKQNEQRIWFLDDAWGTVTTLKDHLKMYNELAKDGFYGLRHRIPYVNDRRRKRQVANQIADELDIKADVVVFSFQEGMRDKFTLLRRLQSRGVKVAISISESKTGVQLSLRRNRGLSEQDRGKILLNKLAEEMGGGGHEGAAGASMASRETALILIKNWSEQLNLSMIEHNLV